MSDRPRIVAERKRRAREMKPPQEFLIHEWGKPYAGIDVYISQVAFDKMMSQCASYAKRHLEALGYLVGDYCRWKNKEYTIVEDAVTSDLETTSVSVHFQAFEKAFDQLDKIDFDYVIVGWYHSHPGFTTFLSEKDLETQKKNFNKPYHATIVIDPVNRQFRSYKVIDDRYMEKKFSLFEQSPMERELTDKRRKEILTYIDKLVMRHLNPGENPEPLDVPGEGHRVAMRTRLPEEVRQTIETDIKRMIEEHRRAEKKA